MRWKALNEPRSVSIRKRERHVATQHKAAQLLQPYEAKLRVKERKHPKLYWTDAGTVRAMKRQLHEPAAAVPGPER